MATAPAPRPQEVKKRQMVEVKAPEQFQFSKQGQQIAGILVQLEPIPVKGKEAIEYLFQGENGNRFTCLGTADLNKKLHAGMIGHWVEIRYENDDNSFTKPGQSPMKMFRVQVASDKEPGF